MTKTEREAQRDALLIVLIDAKIKQLNGMLDLNKSNISRINLSHYSIIKQITSLNEEKNRILNDSEYLNFIIEED